MPKISPIKVKVRDTQTMVFEGEVDRISSFNEIGQFDVYPLHANFISIIRKHLELYHNREKVKELPFEQAVMKVKKDEVNIFLGIEAFSLEDQLSGNIKEEKDKQPQSPPKKT